MRMTAKIIVLLILLAALLTGGAVVKNRVPLTEPPGLMKRLTIYLTRNTARTQPDHELPELRTRAYDLPADRLLALTAQAAADAGWQLANRDAGSRRIDAVVTTPWLRFKDDVRVSLHETSGDRTLAEIQSRSRIGRADYGANIAHIIELYRRLDALSGRSDSDQRAK